MENQLAYKSWINYYLSIMVFALILSVTTQLGIYCWVFNHLFVILAYFTEFIRIKKHFRLRKFNVYAYKTGGWNFQRRLIRASKLDIINEDIRADIKRYILFWRILYCACAINFISLFWISQFFFKI